MGNVKSMPCTPGPPVTGFKFGSGIWSMLEGIPTADPNATPLPGQTLYRSYLIHKYDKRAAAAGHLNQAGKPEIPQHELDSAKNAMRRLKMLRHPYVLRFVEGGETEDAILMVTEPAVPLSAWLEANKPEADGRPGPGGTKKADFESACVWGVYSLVTGLNFLAGCDLLHGNLSVDTVFVTKGGDWKLGGFDRCVEASGGDGTFPDRWFRDNDANGPCPAPFKAPERSSGEWSLVSSAPKTAMDAYGLGVLLATVFFPRDGDDIGTAPGDAKVALDAMRSAGSPVPPVLRPVIARLLATNPKQRLTFADILGSEYFRHPLVGTLLFLDELALKEPADKARFFKSLPGLLPKVPDSIAKYRILPALMTALEYGAAGGGGTVVLAPILDIGARLPPEEYTSTIVPCVVRLFGSNDRATRVQLLHHLPSYIDKLGDDILNATIVHNVLGGFGDTNALLREATVKACLHLAPRMSAPNINGVMLRALKARLADTEPAIRVNTTICLGRIACHVSDAKEREDTLLAAFLREMRDPFPHARAAALRAVAHTLSLEDGGYWGVDTLSKKLMPAACYCATDPSGDTRASAFLVLDGGTAILRALSDARAAEDAAREEAGNVPGGEDVGNAPSGEGATGSAAAAASLGGGLVPASAAGAVGAVFGTLGWAVSSFTSKILPTGTIGEGGAAAGAGAAPSSTSSGGSTPVHHGNGSGTVGASPTGSAGSGTPFSNSSQPASGDNSSSSSRRPVPSASLSSASRASLPASGDFDDADGWGEEADATAAALPRKPVASSRLGAKARAGSAAAAGDEGEPGAVHSSSGSRAAGGPARTRPTAGSSSSSSSSATRLGGSKGDVSASALAHAVSASVTIDEDDEGGHTVRTGRGTRLSGVRSALHGTSAAAPTSKAAPSDSGWGSSGADNGWGEGDTDVPAPVSQQLPQPNLKAPKALPVKKLGGGSSSSSNAKSNAAKSGGGDDGWGDDEW